MRTTTIGAAVLALGLTLLGAAPARAKIDGLTGTSFALTARADFLSTAEGGTLLFWGLDPGTGRAQYPAPTLIVTAGDTVTVTLTNTLAVPTSLVFPGHVATAAGGAAGLLTREAPAGGGTVTYTFTATNPGTYLYQSGTSPELQIEMGIVGALIVRPAGFDPLAPTAYGTPDTAYTDEVLFLMTEMDPRIHDLVMEQGVAALQGADYLTNWQSNYWFLNGRTAPDTMAAAFIGYLPTQPYDCMPMMHPGDTLLVRGVAGGRELHPLHLHGNHFKIVARDARLLASGPGATSADLAVQEFTHAEAPGGTWDATFGWTGEKLGWDIYGTGPGYEHDCAPDADGFDVMTREYCADHGKPIPVLLPEILERSAGPFYGGSPYLGDTKEMLWNEGGFNPDGAFVYMWHSHQERDMVNYDVFPGGMMTMLMVLPPGAPMP
jgi:FtsP/CotA-like multicopper oxidase with cupredoxin domain